MTSCIETVVLVDVCIREEMESEAAEVKRSPSASPMKDEVLAKTTNYVQCLLLSKDAPLHAHAHVPWYSVRCTHHRALDSMAGIIASLV